MELAVQVKLAPTAVQAAALAETLHANNRDGNLRGARLPAPCLRRRETGRVLRGRGAAVRRAETVDRARRRDGMWLLLVAVEVPEPPLNENPGGFVGVDLGVANIATTSGGLRGGGARAGP